MDFAALLDLNYILLFIAIGSPLVLFVQLWRSRSARHREWKIAAAIVFLGTVAAFVFAHDIAGYLGGALWGLLLLLPSVLERRIGTLLLERRYTRARQFAVVRRILHPWGDSVYRPELLRCLELARAGEMNAALDRLATARSETTAAGRFAIALTFTFTENWAGLVSWCRRDPATMADSALQPFYFRALGETGACDDLARQVAIRFAAEDEARLTNNPSSALGLAYLLAFCGRSEALVRLLRRDLGKMPGDQQQFWIATAELAEGRTRPARERLNKIREQTDDAILRRAVERRLTQSADFSAPRLSPSSEVLLAKMIGPTPGGAAETAVARRTRGAPAVWMFIVLNLAMFGVEWLAGGSTNGEILHNLGALEPATVIEGHEYWRLLTSLFLHYGWLHVAVNLYALYLLGPELERLIGSTKFAISYLIAGLGSSAGVVLLYMVGLTNAGQLVGASGCVMGVIGVSAGLLLRHRRSPLHGRRLRYIILIVIVQTAIDLSSPQVSLAAHLSGFVSGVVIGIILGSSRRLTTSQGWDR